jgi:hypothetical protein
MKADEIRREQYIRMVLVILLVTVLNWLTQWITTESNIRFLQKKPP